ncbi:THUMP domain-containing protein 2 isoform X2 [Amia ocellicauda]|uniref:THUMP domain-containing protein 2 isoform X2 n=1 Tax=Amia ocellicauda TaxID=2972642 RepID=UPI003463BC2D
MKESSRVCRPLRYFCTAGNGMEQFLVEEIISKLSAYEVDHVSGKVFFTTSAEIVKLTELKSAERLFLLLKKAPPLNVAWKKGSENVMRLIQDQIMGGHQAWADGLSAWLSFQKDLQDCSMKPSDAIKGQKKKRKVEEEEEEEMGGKSLYDRASLAQTPAETCYPGHETGSTEDEVSMVANCIEERTSCEADESTSSNQSPVSFRVCCRCSGIIAKKFSTQELGRIIGMAITRQLGWKVDLRHPELEVNVHLSDNLCVLGIPVLRFPLAHRTYIKITGLRSTTAWVMASLAGIKPGCLVLDPMCGVGTILLEAAKEWQNAFFLGFDNDELQLKRVQENVRFADLMNRIELIKASVMEIPLPSSSVDAIVCDIPFGRKYCSNTDIRAALPAIVKEMESPQLSVFLKKILGQDCWLNRRPAADSLAERVEVQCAEEVTVKGVTEEKTNPNCSSATSQLCPSLVLNGTYRLSLGATDALIHRYKKVSLT